MTQFTNLPDVRVVGAMYDKGAIMLKRTITAVVAIALFIPVCIFSDTLIFPAVMALLSVIGVYEMLGCVGVKNHRILSAVCIIFGALPLVPFFAGENAIEIITAVSVVFLIAVYAIDVFSKGKIDYTLSASSFMGVFYIAVSFTAIVLLRRDSEYSYLLVFIGPWVSDTFAYIFGRLLGKHKLIPEVSPKKTIEGSIAGIIFAAISYVLYAYIISHFFDNSLTPNYIVMAVSGALVSIVSQIGDLSASAVKRRFGIKDYGFIFPGHGGVMDRFDSVIMTAPILYIISCLPITAGLLI
jgi:phosphatidate cytidylyltransferase